MRVRNYGAQELHNVPLKLGIDGRQRSMATFSIGPGAHDQPLDWICTEAGLTRINRPA